MKKTLLIVVASVAVTAGAAYGALWADVVASAGFYLDASGDPVLVEGSTDSALVQLIWSPNVTADAVDLGDANLVGGDDVWLATYTYTEDGNPNNFDGYIFWSAGFFPTHEGPDIGTPPDDLGFVYARVFENDTPALDTWYYTSETVAALSNPGDGTVPAQPVELNRNFEVGDAIDAGPYAAQVVPEPGTFALFGIGALVVGLRRRKR